MHCYSELELCISAMLDVLLISLTVLTGPLCVGIKPGLSLAFSDIMVYSTPSRKLRGQMNWAQEEEGSKVANLSIVEKQRYQEYLEEIIQT